MAIITLNNRSINRSDTASAGQVWTATSATAADFQAAGGNTPMILVHPNSGQTISSATNTKVTLDTEIIDTDSTFASDKWTPGVAGKYYISATTSINRVIEVNMSIYIYIYKCAQHIYIYIHNT